MTLRPIHALAPLLFLFSAASLGGQPKLASLRLGESPYEIARPALWLQGPITGEYVLSSWVASDRYLYPLMSVTLEPLPVAGEKGVEQLLASLSTTLPGFKLQQSSWVEFGGIRGHRSVSTWTSIFGEAKATRLLVPWQEKVFVVTFADLEATFAQNAELYDLCISALARYEAVETPKRD